MPRQWRRGAREVGYGVEGSHARGRTVEERLHEAAHVPDRCPDAAGRGQCFAGPGLDTATAATIGCRRPKPLCSRDPSAASP